LHNKDFRYVTISFLALGLFVGAVFWQAWHQPNVRISHVAPHGVALIDELSLTDPDPAFVSQVNETLEGAGFWLQYYPPEAVVVPLFWALPALGYEFVIVRAHSTGWFTGDRVTIFTSEKYSPNKYYWEQLNNYVSRASIIGGDQLYFTVTPQYVWKVSQGSFPGSILIMMGCTGLANNGMADAFVKKGAEAYVSWYDPVDASRTDTATSSLVNALFEQHMTLEKAVSYTNGQISAGGSATLFGYSYVDGLGYYPVSAGNVQVSTRTLS
jgi:hypothetical protein